MKRNGRPRRLSGIALLVGVGIFLGGCATMGEKPKSALTQTDRDTVIYLDKYEFQKPPAGWTLMKNLEGGDFELGFFKIEKGPFPSQSTFFYDDQPFGSSRELDVRAKQYCSRFLWNTGMSLEIRKREKVQLWGHPALAIHMEGENPPRDEKARSLIYLVQKGERIISFVLTQWRPLNGTFDQDAFERFDSFVGSFKFLQKDFYEELEGRIKQLKGGT